jgi:hypothetical protein
VNFEFKGALGGDFFFICFFFHFFQLKTGKHPSGCRAWLLTAFFSSIFQLKTRKFSCQV